MPRTLAQARLNGAYEAAKILIDAYGDETARSWFFGTSSQLEDEAPAYLLRRMKTPDEGRRIVIAARAFVTVA